MCYDTNDMTHGYWPKDVFKRKLRTGDITPDHAEWEGRYWQDLHEDKTVTKWQHDDFDPAYGLEGKEADSIMDWVRAIFPPFALSHFLTRTYRSLRVCVCVRVHRSGG